MHFENLTPFCFFLVTSLKHRCKITSTPVWSSVRHFVFILISFHFVYTHSHLFNEGLELFGLLCTCAHVHMCILVHAHATVQ